MLGWCMYYIYIYMFACMYVTVCVYIYIYSIHMERAVTKDSTMIVQTTFLTAVL